MVIYGELLQNNNYLKRKRQMKYKRLFGTVISFGISIGLIFLVLSNAGFSNIVIYLKDMDYRYILCAVILYTIDMFLRAYRWKEILSDNKIFIKLKDSFLAYNLGNSFNIIVPAKIGDIARSYYLKKKHGYGYLSTLPATFLDRLFDIIGVYIVIFFSGIYVVSRVEIPSWLFNLMIGGIICLSMVFIVMACLIGRRDRLEKFSKGKVGNFIFTMVCGIEGSLKNLRKFIKYTVCSVLIWCFEGLLTYFVFLSMHQAINPLVAVFSSMIATFTKVFPITPGGIGVFEGAMVIILSLFNFNSGITGVISTLNHFIMNLYTVAAGIVALIKSGISVRQISSEGVGNR
jgi:conserved hypothetical protein